MKDINYFALFVVALLNLGIGAVWFLYLFREPFVAGLNKTKEEMAQGPSGISAGIMQLIGNLLMAFVLAWLIQKLNYQTPLKGLELGAIIWLGFVAAVLGPMYAFEAYSLSFFFITAGSVLVSLLVAGGILGAWN